MLNRSPGKPPTSIGPGRPSEELSVKLSQGFPKLPLGAGPEPERTRAWKMMSASVLGLLEAMDDVLD